MKLENLSWLELKEKIFDNPVFILPIGSIEQHGSHGVLGTDFLIPKYICEEIEKVENIILLPPIPYGVCPYHTDFPGSIDLGYDILFGIIYRIVKKLKEDGMKKLLIINGHGGNTPAIEDALTLLSKDIQLAVIDWWRLAGELNPKYRGGHGDKQETSAIMAIDKSIIKLERVKPQNIKNISSNIIYQNSIDAKFKNGSVKIIKNTKDIIEDGWIGNLDPIESCEEFGKEMLKEVILYIKEFLEEFKKVK